MTPVKGYALQRHVFKQIYLQVDTEFNDDCRYECLMERNCVSVNVGPPNESGFRLCQLSDSDHIQHPEDLEPEKESIYWATTVRGYTTIK